jgi:hypothetical protein
VIGVPFLIDEARSGFYIVVVTMIVVLGFRDGCPTWRVS